MPGTIHIRFYEELNDFLPCERRKTTFNHSFSGQPTIKDIIESLGIPHVEVDLILANGQSVDFNFKPGANDLISVYPVFESLDISQVTRLRPKPLRNIRLILDVHLGKLARYLRLLGFDSLYETDLKDEQIVTISSKEKRIVLTRDIQLLKNGLVTHGYWIRSQNPVEQLKEVIQRLDLSKKVRPFHRCMECNGIIRHVDKTEIIDDLQPKTKAHYKDFYRCGQCRHIYWNGSHYQRMVSMLETLDIIISAPK
ncbi:MAG: Mut7-C ubiquitin/RNAse domain-containing protein [Lentimicrobiaceae bacterium]|nr:Mut7-C ubiquitin/RNAse domain-containing protein [Lentimicrobiaceae bacterium]